MGERITAYITKYALTEIILELEVELCSSVHCRSQSGNTGRV